MLGTVLDAGDLAVNKTDLNRHPSPLPPCAILELLFQRVCVRVCVFGVGVVSVSKYWNKMQYVPGGGQGSREGHSGSVGILGSPWLASLGGWEEGQQQRGRQG